MGNFAFGMVVALTIEMFFLGTPTAHDVKQDKRIEALQTQVAQLEAK